MQRVCEEAWACPVSAAYKRVRSGQRRRVSVRARSGSCPKRRSRRRSRFRGRWLPRMRFGCSPLSPGAEWTSTIAVVRRRIAEKVEQLGEDGFDMQRLWSWVRARVPETGTQCQSGRRRRPARGRSSRAVGDRRSRVRASRRPVWPKDTCLAGCSRRPDQGLPARRERAPERLALTSPTSRRMTHPARVPLGFVIADLLDHGGPRERSQAANLLAASAR